MQNPTYLWPVNPQVYKFALGTVREGCFTPASGDLHPHGLPLFWLLGVREGKPRGRKPKTLEAIKAAHTREPETFAYGLDAAGQWYSVRYTADGKARARTVDGAPYTKMARGRRWSTIKLIREATAALQLATAAQLREVTGCDLL